MITQIADDGWRVAGHRLSGWWEQSLLDLGDGFETSSAAKLRRTNEVPRPLRLLHKHRANDLYCIINSAPRPLLPLARAVARSDPERATAYLCRRLQESPGGCHYVGVEITPRV